MLGRALLTGTAGHGADAWQGTAAGAWCPVRLSQVLGRGLLHTGQALADTAQVLGRGLGLLQTGHALGMRLPDTGQVLGHTGQVLGRRDCCRRGTRLA